MKKLVAFIVGILLTMTCMAQQNTLVVKGKGIDLHKYKYAYVIPTSSVISGGLRYSAFSGIGGGQNKSINPSDNISGCLMKMGYAVLPSINPDLADKTLVVSYGNIDGAVENYSATSNIVIQMRDAQTQELALSIETFGRGTEETDAITDAIYRALRRFKYILNPKVTGRVLKERRYATVIGLTNQTPADVNQVMLKLSYFINDELVHEQETTINRSIFPDEEVFVRIVRDKGYRSKKFEIIYKVLGYK